jgi:YVTN family beta-propeller protein
LVLTAGAAGLAAWLTDAGGSPAAAVRAASIVALDARTNRLAGFSVAWHPQRLVLDAHTLWLANNHDLTIARFDLTGHRVEQTIGVGVSTATLAAGAGAVWVLSDQQELIRVDPAFGVLKTKRLPLGEGQQNSLGDPAGIAVGSGSVWIQDGGRTLLRIDPRTSAVERRLDLGRRIDTVAYGDGSVWVTAGEPASLLRIDPRTNAVTARIPIAGRRGVQAPYPIGLAVGAGAVWVLNGNTGTVTRIDPTLNAVTATTPRLSVDPTRIAAGAGAAWVADAANDSVMRIDPVTGRVLRVIPVGGRPVALAAGNRKVWISVDAP